MKNDTMRLLERVVFLMEKDILQEEREYVEMEQTRRDLTGRFYEHHAGDHGLIREVNQILDAYAGEEEYKSEFRLFLGLQMGLELGALDMLRRSGDPE